MEKEELKKAMHLSISKEVEQWAEESQQIKDGYEFEDRLLLRMRNIGKILMEQSLGRVPKSPNQKKIHTCVGTLEVSNSHPLAQLKGSFKISRKLQELMCMVGQSQVFEDGEELFMKMMGLPVSAKQVQRVSEHYGEHIEAEHQRYIEEGESAPSIADKHTDTVYMMADGAMIYTREEGWKEMKVGRIFAQKDCVRVQEKRNEIVKNQYVCHLGDHQEFLSKFECYVNDYRKKVFIADGAKWIWNWVKDTYPEAVQILDYYHAVEKISIYAAEQIPDTDQRKKWLAKQKELLSDDKVVTVLNTIRQQQGRTPAAEKQRNAVIGYYENNLKRMQYKTFREGGYLIGSGPIESANRTVLQQRLKLSGQKWNIKGAQRIINLRAYQKSDRWDDVVEIIKMAA